MRAREWERIIRQANVEAFGRWLETLSSQAQWPREDVCACPLHNFIQWAAGESLCVNSPELSEHWHVRESQTWPTPWWMTWMMRSIDNTGEGKIGLNDLRRIFNAGVKRDWFGDYPLTASSRQKAGFECLI